MSGALALVGTGLTLGLPALQQTGLVPAWIRQGRKIGSIIPDVVIEEQHADRLTVTQHPIADGSPISDHAYRMPATLTMRCGWSNANVVGAAVSGFMSGGLSGAGAGALSSLTESRAKEIYAKLRAMQGTPETPVQLFDITTGKRDYTNMALLELSVTTDHTKEYSLFVEAHFQEVFRVKTRSTTQPASTEMVGYGSKTAETQDTTPRQPDPIKPQDRRSILQPLTGYDFQKSFVPPVPSP